MQALLGGKIFYYVSEKSSSVISPCLWREENVMIQSWNMLNANIRRDFFGSFLIVKSIFIMFPSVFRGNTISKWIRGEGI